MNPKQIDPVALEREFTVYIHTFMEKLVEFYKEYPPPPAGSTYVRTNKLFEGWHVLTERYSQHLRSTAFNTAVDKRRNPRPYMQFVQGIHQTPQHHMTGWLTFTPTNTVYGFQKYFEKDLKAIVKSHIAARKKPSKVEV